MLFPTLSPFSFTPNLLQRHFYILYTYTDSTDNTQFKINVFILFKYTDFVGLKCCKQNSTYLLYQFHSKISFD